MGFLGTADPNYNKHFCDTPGSWFKRKWTVWRCDRCQQTWRLEPADYAEMEGWHWHTYNGKVTDPR